MIILILCISILTSCSHSSDEQFKSFIDAEAKSVTTHNYSIFISKYKNLMSDEALLKFQDVYYMKPDASDMEVSKIYTAVSNGRGMSLYKISKGGVTTRFRLTFIDFEIQVNDFQVYTLYEV